MLGEETSAVTWGPVMGLHLYTCREQKGLMGRMAKGTREKGGMERLQSVFCIGRDIVGAARALPELATSSTKKKHGSWRKVNVTVPGILLCSAVSLFSHIESWLIGVLSGFLSGSRAVKYSLENTCKTFGYHQSLQLQIRRLSLE